MIRLERLRVEGFKRLTGIDLSFPAQCQVLIEGQNEAGKSTLFESIYFALYGDALVKRGGGRGQTSSAIQHGLSEAFVALTLSIGDTRLEIQRSIFRQRANSAQLTVTYPDRDPEVVTGPSAVNRRVIRELNGLDGDALRNSCFVEQKQLGKLEGLTKAKREEVLLKLLELDRLTALGRAFQWGVGDDHKLDISRSKLRLAQAARELADIHQQQAQVERRLKWVAVHRALDEIDRQNEIIREKSAEQQRQKAIASRLTEQLARLHDLREAETSLQALQEYLSRIVDFEAEIRRLQDRLNNLDRLESEELPARRVDLKVWRMLQSRLHTIQKLETVCQQAERDRERLENIRSLADRLTDLQRGLEALEKEEQIAREHTERANYQLQVARSIEALQRWKAAHRATQALVDADEQITRAREQAEQFRRRRERLRRERKPLLIMGVGILLLIAALLSGGAGFLLAITLLRPVTVALAVGGVAIEAYGLRLYRRRRIGLAQYDSHLQECSRLIEEQERRKETVRDQNPPTLEACVTQLERLGVDVPETEEQANAVIATWQDELGAYDMSLLMQAVSDAQSELGGLEERRRTGEEEVARVQDALETALAEAEVDLLDLAAVRDRIEALQSREASSKEAIRNEWEAMADAMARFGLPRETELALNRVAEQIGKLNQEIMNLEDQIHNREELKRQQEEWQQRVAETQNRVREQRDKLEALAEKTGEPIAVAGDEDVLQVLEVVGRILAEQDERQMQRERDAAQQAAANARAAIRQAEETIASAKEDIKQILTQLALPTPDVLSREALASLDSEFVQLSVAAQVKLQEQRDRLLGEAKSRQDEITRLEGELNIRHQDLNEGRCREEVAALEQREAICHRARSIVEGVRKRMLAQVLPGTIAHMQLILPLLTAGRYHHAELNAENYKMRVWDSRAGERGEYVEKDFFSGGTQDQFSLALRLGFALAALPQEKGVSPGFIFLDEPLSAFDRQRTAALVQLLTEGEIAQRFDQIFLIAHDRTFADCPFPYYVRLAEGRIVEHNLPNGGARE
jgi:exonuclease SbcC